MWRNCEEGQAVQKIERKIKLSRSACRCNKKDDTIVSEFDNECKQYGSICSRGNIVSTVVKSFKI